MDSEPEACRAVVALSEAQVAVANAGCKAVDPAFPRITGLGPGAADSDPRAAPAIQDGLGQVTLLFRKSLVSPSTYTTEGCGRFQLEPGAVD